MNTLFVVARLLHILGGLFWVGAVLTSVFFIEPTAQALGAPGHRFLAHVISRRRLTNVMAVAATTAIVSGAYLYWIDSGGLNFAWISTGTGAAFTAGALAALAAFGLAAAFLKPGFERLATLAENAQDEEESALEAEHLAARLRPYSLVQVGLLVFAVAAMATARHLS